MTDSFRLCSHKGFLCGLNKKKSISVINTQIGQSFMSLHYTALGLFMERISNSAYQKLSQQSRVLYISRTGRGKKSVVIINTISYTRVFPAMTSQSVSVKKKACGQS